MNDRIKQLADRANGPNPFFGPLKNHMVLLGDEAVEKFAELIVQECIDKITTYDLVPGHSAKWEDIYDIHARLLQDLGEELKEHFGVTK
jgi:hypothetical protein